MGRFLLGIITTLLVLAGIVGILIVLEQNKIIDAKPTAIGVLGKLPGWNDLPKIFESGKQGLKNWNEKEKTYLARVEALKKEIAKLQKELAKAETANVTPDKAENTSNTPVKTTDAKAKLPEAMASTKHAARLLGDMKPQAAAAILLKIRPDVALEILEKVETRKAAKIIEAMPVDSGSALLAKLAEKR